MLSRPRNAKSTSEESLIDKLIELNVNQNSDKSLTELVSELDDQDLLNKLFPYAPSAPKERNDIETDLKALKKEENGQESGKVRI